MMNEKIKRYALFWGCTIQFRLPWIELSARRVLPELGVDIVDLPFSCCPDPVSTKAIDHKTWLALAARNLTIAEEEDLNILTLCSGCFETLRMAQEEMRDKKIKEEINSILKETGREYNGKIEVIHLEQLLYERIGLKKIEDYATRPIKLRVAVHVGCHFTRPSNILKTDDPLYPEKLDELCRAIGLETPDYPDKNLCCGVGVGLVDRDIMSKLIIRKIKGAKMVGADAIVSHCPSCILNYDTGQYILAGSEMERMPVFHYLELLGLAIGIDPDEFAFDEHKIKLPDITF